MANADVQVREIQLLEAYSGTFKGFMEATIAMTYRFHNLFGWKDDEARDQAHRIRDTTELIRQRMTHAKDELEASQKSGRNDGGRELAHRQQAYEKYKELYKRAQQYEESSKKLQQKVHGEVERVIHMNRRFRWKLENSMEEGKNFLEKAIDTLKNYHQ